MTSSAWQDRFGWWIIAFFLALTPIVGYGTKAAFDGIKNRVEDWLPDSFEETQRLMWFYERFGTDELLMISWEGCTLEDPRIAVYKEHLDALDSSETPAADYFSEVLTGPEAVESLVSEPLDLPREEAIGRLRGWLVGPDGEHTCLIAIVKNAAEVDRAAAVEYAYRCAEAVEGLAREDLVIAGPTRDGVAIDEASKNSLAQLNLGSFGVCLAIMALGLRSIRATILIFLVAIFCEQLSMAIMYFSGQQMDSVLTLASNLTYVLAISSGVHLMNYYRESLAERSSFESVGWAFRAALVPCLLSAGTTAVGMFSLTVSNIQPVTNFGWYAAISVIAAALVLLLWAPAAMYKFPINPPAWRGRSERPSRMRPLWDRLAIAIEKLRWPIFIFSLVVVLVCLVGVQRISTSAQLHDLFGSDAPILRDYDWLEEKVGPLIPIEIVLRYDDPQQTATDERFRVLQAVQQAIEETDGVSATMSAATFAPNIPPADQPGFRAVMQRASIRKILEGRLTEYEEINYLRREDGDELWRISARVRAADRLNYGDLMQRLRNSVAEELEGRQGVEPIYSGSVPLIFKAQTEMLHDLIRSFGLAFVMIAVIMIVLLRNVLTGVFCMVPNIMPVLLAFGLMGFLGVSVEIGTLLTASAALGIAVDDSLHYITWFNRGLAKGLSRLDAARLAYEHCGLAMIQTSLICSLGLLVFALSPFTPVSRFAWMMFSLLLMALICDLLILPAVLFCFTRKRSTPGI
ncbi:MAG: MMPL family transporter [Pirellulaceae bacterium]